MSHIYLQIKLAALADEARIIRRKEEKYKKWIRRTIPLDSTMSEEAKKGFEEKGWKIKIQAPRSNVSMPQTSEEKAEYRTNVWKQKARLRRLNRQHNPELRHSLWNHRVYKVRPEARACHLALGFMKERPYKTIEVTCHDNNKVDNILIEKIWFNVSKFSKREETSEKGKELIKNWLEGVLPSIPLTSGSRT